MAEPVAAELWIAGGRLLGDQGTRAGALGIAQGRVVGEAEKPPRGARFVKLAFDARYPVLDAQVARIAADEAHRLGLAVAAHALDAEAVRRALEAGADVLAHAPVERLPDELVREIGARWIISTLRAFGGGEAALDNLRRLRAAGARVVYGTDLGNEGTVPGIDAGELSLLLQAGLTAR